MVTWLALCADSAFCTAARTCVAVLESVAIECNDKETGHIYLACSLWNPLCASTEEEIPGKSDESRLSRIASASVASASLGKFTCHSSLLT